MNQSPKTAVYMDDTQARVFMLLLQAHAFDIPNGSVEIHFTGGQPVKAKVTLYTNAVIDSSVHIVV